MSCCNIEVCIPQASRKGSASCTQISRPGSRRASRQSSRTSRCPAMPAQPPCYLHPRNDCNIPCCERPPKCPVGIYVKKTEPFIPDRRYIPPTIKFEGLTTYRDNYYEKCRDKALSFKPASQFDPSDAKFVGLTSYREQYYPKCSKKEKSFKPTISANFSDSPFNEMSTYRFDYHLKCGPKAVSLKPNSEFTPSDAKMDGLTTYRLNYIPFCPREYSFAKQPMAKKPTGGDTSCSPFNGATTYRMDYYCKPIIRQRSLKPNTRPQFSDAKMNGHTTYRNDYIPFTFEKCREDCVPAEVYDQLYPRCGLFACGAEPEEKIENIVSDPCPPPPFCSVGPPKNCCPPECFPPVMETCLDTCGDGPQNTYQANQGQDGAC